MSVSEIPERKGSQDPNQTATKPASRAFEAVVPQLDRRPDGADAGSHGSHSQTLDIEDILPGVDDSAVVPGLPPAVVGEVSSMMAAAMGPGQRARIPDSARQPVHKVVATKVVTREDDVPDGWVSAAQNPLAAGYKNPYSSAGREVAAADGDKSFEELKSGRPRATFFPDESVRDKTADSPDGIGIEVATTYENSHFSAPAGENPRLVDAGSDDESVLNSGQNSQASPAKQTPRQVSFRRILHTVVTQATRPDTPVAASAAIEEDRPVTATAKSSTESATAPSAPAGDREPADTGSTKQREEVNHVVAASDLAKDQQPPVETQALHVMSDSTHSSHEESAAALVEVAQSVKDHPAQLTTGMSADIVAEQGRSVEPVQVQEDATEVRVVHHEGSGDSIHAHPAVYTVSTAADLPAPVESAAELGIQVPQERVTRPQELRQQVPRVAVADASQIPNPELEALMAQIRRQRPTLATERYDLPEARPALEERIIPAVPDVPVEAQLVNEDEGPINELAPMQELPASVANKNVDLELSVDVEEEDLRTKFDRAAGVLREPWATYALMLRHPLLVRALREDLRQERLASKVLGDPEIPIFVGESEKIVNPERIISANVAIYQLRGEQVKLKKGVAAEQRRGGKTAREKMRAKGAVSVAGGTVSGVATELLNEIQEHEGWLTKPLAHPIRTLFSQDWSQFFHLPYTDLLHMPLGDMTITTAIAGGILGTLAYIRAQTLPESDVEKHDRISDTITAHQTALVEFQKIARQNGK